MTRDQPIVSVFGSSLATADSAPYQRAYALGRGLVASGYDVMSGGYSGLMEAVSKGATELGGKAIGVCTPSIEPLRPGTLPNEFLAEVIWKETMTERLLFLTRQCDAAVVLDGGAGTLTELALSWHYLTTMERDPFPIIAVGDIWKKSLEPLLSSGLVNQESSDFLSLVDTIEEVVPLLNARMNGSVS